VVGGFASAYYWSSSENNNNNAWNQNFDNGNQNNITGTAANLAAGKVTTNANGKNKFLSNSENIHFTELPKNDSFLKWGMVIRLIKD
jgi:hypothetical protein